MTMTMLDTCCELLLFFMSSWLSAPQFNIIPIVLCYKSSYLPKLNNKNMRQCDRWVVVGHTPHISYDIVGRWNFVDGLIWLSNHCAIQLPFFFVLRCAVHRDHEHADLNRWTCQFSIVDDIVESCNNEWMLNKTYTYVRLLSFQLICNCHGTAASIEHKMLWKFEISFWYRVWWMAIFIAFIYTIEIRFPYTHLFFWHTEKMPPNPIFKYIKSSHFFFFFF